MKTEFVLHEVQTKLSYMILMNFMFQYIKIHAWIPLSHGISNPKKIRMFSFLLGFKSISFLL